ncbi:MAG: DUF4910 domain-containing protein [Candidatus Lokiarchaeota archaeon]|nr:DUF4910 domain-containing protein [Candidatus Lokiarchaeota archaeon]
MADAKDLGKQMYELCELLFPICRSITGNGVRKTLSIIKQHLPGIQVHEVPSGTAVFDWTVPKEWDIEDAYIIDPSGKKIVDFHQCNLHVVGYSTPIDATLDLDDLQEHLYSLPDQPAAIPYITSYYKERWGFCISEQMRKSLQPGKYHVVIKSKLFDGSLTYGELLLPGKTTKEIFLSTYICHPSMANNELSGPVVTTFLVKWLMQIPDRYYSYRVVFIPETIGSITYLSKHLEHMKERIVAGFVITCIGDNRAYSVLTSRNENTLADEVALHVLKNLHPEFIKYSFLERGSDERQYCSPGVDLPVASIMRTKYGRYPEYHTSLDDLSLISPEGLQGGFEAVQKCIEVLENNMTPKVRTLCEPQLGKRNLYPTLSTKKSGEYIKDMMNLIAYSDGKRTLLEIAELINVPAWKLHDIVEKLRKEDLLEVVR